MSTQPVDHGALSSKAAERMRDLLHKQRVSHRAFARELGVSPNTISNRCNGVTPLTLDDIEHLCRRFSVPVSYFLDDDEAPAAPQERRRLHRVRHDDTVEAAIRYSLDNDGERVTLSDEQGLTIIEDGQIVAQITKRQGRGQGQESGCSSPLAGGITYLRHLSPRITPHESARVRLVRGVNKHDRLHQSVPELSDLAALVADRDRCAA